MISIIAAIGENRELGKSGSLLWHLPKDFKYFKEMTLNKAIIMGRKTFESIGKALPNRQSIVITSQDDWHQDGAIRASGLIDAVNKAQELNLPIMIIGGGDIYRQSIPTVDTMYLTEVKGSFPYADTFFPEFEKKDWIEISRIHNEKDEDNDFEFDFVEYKKK
jgi:dihydrofolate reductase